MTGNSSLLIGGHHWAALHVELRINCCIKIKKKKSADHEVSSSTRHHLWGFPHVSDVTCCCMFVAVTRCSCCLAACAAYRGDIDLTLTPAIRKAETCQSHIKYGEKLLLVRISFSGQQGGCSKAQTFDTSCVLMQRHRPSRCDANLRYWVLLRLRPDLSSVCLPAAYKVTIKSTAAEGDFMIYTAAVVEVLKNTGKDGVRVTEELTRSHVCFHLNNNRVYTQTAHTSQPHTV